MFVLVVCLSYALYVLVTPYYYSITGGVLLSIVTHPQGRLRSVLYMGTAVDRMRHVQQQWAVRGRLAGVVGSWMSLRHFASFVVMQMTFLLGLNKIRVATNSVLLGHGSGAACFSECGRAQEMASATGRAARKAPKEAERAGESRASSPKPGVLQDAAHWKDATATLHATNNGTTGPVSASPNNERGSSGGSTSSSAEGSPESRSQTLRFPAKAPQMPSPSDDSIRLSPAAAAVPDHRRLVATARGRRVLRYLTIAILVILAHLLVGVFYFVLLHLVLGVVFALAVPLLSANSFVRSMGRLWRVAIVLFFIVGLTLNLTADVLSISHAVRRTTSAVVRSGGGGGGGGLAGMELDAFTDVKTQDIDSVPSSHYPDSTDATTATTTSIFGIVKEEEEAMDENDVDIFALLRQHRGMLESLVVKQVQTLVVQELADMFSNGNVSEMLGTLMRVLPPQLQAVVQQDAAESSSGGGSAPALVKPGSTKSSLDSSSSSTKSPHSLTFSWANLRALGSVDSLKSLLHASLSNASAANNSRGTNSSSRNRGTTRASSNGSAAGAGAAATGEETVHIDWITVFRLLAAALLPYVEYAVRLVARLASNLLELFDSVYALMLFVFFYRYLTQLEHTVLYYGIAKVLCVIQPDVGDLHARNIEHDITVSFITLLQSFWHLTWFHFCVTFCAFKLWGFPTPFLLGLVSVVLALFPLVPKWLSPCSIAFAYMVIQLISLTTAEEREGSPLLAFPGGHDWTAALLLGKPYLLFYARTLSFGVAVLLECGDEWLLCVSRGLRGGFVTDAAGKGREQLQPFVVGTSLVLGFVAYGIRGIVFGPLTVIVARVLYDNWDIMLLDRENGGAPSSPPPMPSLLVEEEDEEEEQ
ncbi:putative mitochondrial putative multi-pass transmembrane protein [Leptomonas pyrrhocoris]|uniref:Putative mitochondrial putative multi-pass transmembrane protein n=1 Tax=Leptomonas pyrrhocoris TaxID=157538 RepID=A0A0M9FZG6_LEPPY|nr:putative mitochondrial putative multi-pass transmembrane protein [Leptomonas pyrrhocoris]KPA79087.1 putative mitochondrial putative multi-pass transmembrane protein [Leptomonas pyrrhocoris]|eukprot:XP_015657526.1 putative mitochondrial putative multi-pass transmembrane protein [Leptomonas pyrrhocoris]